MADSWSAYMFHTNPIIHTDRLQILLSCEDALFRAGSAKEWAQILNSGSFVLMPSLALDPSSAHLPKFDTLLDGFGILPPASRNTNGLKGKLRVPSEVYALDRRVRFVWSLLFNVVDSYGNRFERMNPNCMVLWHSMCMMLTTDLHIIELGAGCAGAGRARQAFDDIAAWSQTAAARRAGVHAGQTFMIMSKRKVSDGTMFHSESAPFTSALVLGLYLLTVSNTSEADGEETLESLELLDDVDWRSVVHEGFTPNRPPHNGAESLAKRFIRDGGSIQFSSMIHHGGYQSARRILLDCAGLLGDVGKWKARDYSRVLRILSDTLLEVDVPASGETSEPRREASTKLAIRKPVACLTTRHRPYRPSRPARR
ncbi:hypothetical protein LTR06_011213 [Exophiala xenobiotica]|nr:hypothetical protein LTR06_011213 [Exophiala xenobiotica]